LGARVFIDEPEYSKKTIYGIPVLTTTSPLLELDEKKLEESPQVSTIMATLSNNAIDSFCRSVPASQFRIIRAEAVLSCGAEMCDSAHNEDSDCPAISASVPHQYVF